MLSMKITLTREVLILTKNDLKSKYVPNKYTQ